ncbi:hypothetical protein BH23ACT10_BH23ACT10_07170 [soil metagenome]
MLVGMERSNDDAGAMLVRLRKRHGLSQTQLAIRAGTSQAAISRIERGLESPTIDRFADLLQVMGESLSLAADPMTPWADADDAIVERGMSPDERLEEGVRLAEFATELASPNARQDTAGA